MLLVWLWTTKMWRLSRESSTITSAVLSRLFSTFTPWWLSQESIFDTESSFWNQENTFLMSCGDFTCWMPLQKLWKAKNQFWPRPSQKWWSMSNRNTSKYAVVHQSNSQSRWKIFKLSSLKLRPTHQVKNNPQKGTLFQFYVSVGEFYASMVLSKLDLKKLDRLSQSSHLISARKSSLQSRAIRWRR